MNLTGTPSRAPIASAMSGDTPVGSPEGDLPVTRRKLPMLIAARKTPVGASSAARGCGIGWESGDGGSNPRSLTDRRAEGTQILAQPAGQAAASVAGAPADSECRLASHPRTAAAAVLAAEATRV